VADWTEGDVAGANISLHYHRTGGDGPSVVLLHGITDDGLCWSRVARDLEGEYDLVMPDARGHGRSGGIATGFSIDLLADDVAAVIRALDLDRPALYGHSMGAITALVVAARYPEHVRAIVLEDPPLRPAGQGPTEEQRAQARESLLDLQKLSREERIRCGRVANPGWVEEEIIPWADAKARVDPEVMSHFRVPAVYPWQDALPRISCPVLLITGDPARGAIVTPEIASEAEGLWQNGRVAHIAGAGHSIHRDRYDETMAAVRDYLAG
jgi:pimeloyl-ACP methyl ester carboxylesterase